MKSVICVVFLFALSIRADTYYSSAIPCRNDQACERILQQPSRPMCLNGICMCPNATTRMYQYCSNKDIVVGAPRFGGEDRSCSIDMDCGHIQGAKCFRPDMDRMQVGTCDCQADMVMSKDNRHCLPIVKEVFEKCNETIQCTTALEGAECFQGICRCRTNFHSISKRTKCIANKAYGEPCTRDEESCYQLAGPANVNSLGCSDKNVCKCRRNFRVHEGLCQPSGFFVSGAARTVNQLFLVAAMVMLSIVII